MLTSEAGGEWTNTSVLLFAGGKDPLVVASSVAQEVVAAAVDHGLSGPPFDPFALAELLGLSLRARADVADARIRTDTAGVRSTPNHPLRGFVQSDVPLVIEYNPTRPRGRLRYSVAHEIGHSLFADVASAPRHRTGMGAVAEHAFDDGWQLELLCNLIAAELLMPEDAVAGLVNIDPDIDFIMEHRRRFDVSTEALLRRLTTTTSRPLTLVAASRIRDSPDAAFQVDYVVKSSSSALDLPRGTLLPGDSVLGGCVAVGQTVRGSADIAGSTLRIQGVGTPPYPGRLLPRALALVETDSGEGAGQGVDYRTGDVTDAYRDGPALIAHVVNDAARAWGRRGVAAALAAKFPESAREFHAWAVMAPGNLSAGNVHIGTNFRDGVRVDIASLVAQRGYGPGTATRLDYAALRTGLESIADHALRHHLVVHLPRIGTGQAGGRWDMVRDIVVDALVTKGLQVVVHTMPARLGGTRR